VRTGTERSNKERTSQQRRRNETRIQQANPSSVNPLSVLNKNSTLSKEKKRKGDSQVRPCRKLNLNVSQQGLEAMLSSGTVGITHCLSLTWHSRHNTMYVSYKTHNTIRVSCNHLSLPQGHSSFFIDTDCQYIWWGL